MRRPARMSTPQKVEKSLVTIQWLRGSSGALRIAVIGIRVLLWGVSLGELCIAQCQSRGIHVLSIAAVTVGIGDCPGTQRVQEDSVSPKLIGPVWIGPVCWREIGNPIKST